MTAEIDQQCIDTLRFLSVDTVQKANSGRPDLSLGAAAMAYVLWTRALKLRRVELRRMQTATLLS